jgi:hypothetical protein
MADSSTCILTLEWSESPYHQGVYRVFLSYSQKSRRWALSARRNPSAQRLSWRTGEADEDQRKVAVELLAKSYERGAFEFDLIVDAGPFEITIKDIRGNRTPIPEDSVPLGPPEKTCQYCRYLELPVGVGEWRARLFDCGLGMWTHKERRKAKGERAGVLTPRWKHSCERFSLP